MHREVSEMDRNQSEAQLKDYSREAHVAKEKYKDAEKGIRLAESFIKKNYLDVMSTYKLNPMPRSIQEATIVKTVRLFKITSIVFNKDENSLDKLNNIYSALHCLNLSLVMMIKSTVVGGVDFYLGIRSEKGQEIDDSIANIFVKSFQSNFAGSNISSANMEEVTAILEHVLPQDGSNAVTALTNIPALKNDKMENKQFTQGVEKVLDAMKGQEYSILVISDPVNTKKVASIKQGYEELYTELYPFAERESTLGKAEAISASQSELKGFSKTIGSSVAKTQSFSSSSSVTKTESTSKGIALILSYSEQVANSTSEQHGETEGETNSTQEANTSTTQTGTQTGTAMTNSVSFTRKYANKSIKMLLDIIDEQLKRIRNCENYGMWSSAVYLISPNKETTIVGASAYKGLINGDSTALETSSINTWFRDNAVDNERPVAKINGYLRRFIHPKFHNPDFLNEFEGTTDVSLATMISTKELAIQCGIPYKSVVGMSVREMTEFGRNVNIEACQGERKVTIGSIYHMGNVEKNVHVELDAERLCEHTFITGSTGSGKSNTIYGIIAKLWKQYKVPTLVIEPAKGEYKQVFGNDFNVFGTNQNYTELLRINPFKFNSKIHVLEHIDRLIDIFNVCWPMYAAMPAVLKEAVELAYINCGWNLDLSENCYGYQMYPCFKDVLYALRSVIARSEYSQEVKDNYTGSLVTRIKSLTNGINGRIFTSNEIDEDKLFEENTIIDLSRVGSSETKSMIMGIIIMRLQENRMAQGGMNLPLKHFTVLEEAHNILKMTSSQQSSETANLLGKSVEMISNAIAEMRAYGEAFVIADQAPALLDMSVIRNTSTKIILRLPDETDRRLVGKAASLNDNQIIELAKLPTGVAAIYQNKWVEPVLCQIDAYKITAQPYCYFPKKISGFEDEIVRDEVLQYILSGITKEKPENDVEQLKGRLIESALPSITKINLLKLLKNDLPTTLESIYVIVAECFDNLDSAFMLTKVENNIDEWNAALLRELHLEMKFMSAECQNSILECVIRRKANEIKSDEINYLKWMKYMGRKSLC